MTRVPGRAYVVGGAIRDRLLGLPVIDRDHVVVGATVDAMKAAGFRAVGRDFPVFLHPETHEEYALARTERKIAPGYGGFVFHAAPDVTLEADLARRDLTINAMACADADGEDVIDPFGGRRDVDARVFRHIGPAFAEDPVRILRVARFAARFADFTVADETMTLMRSMVDAGEVDALVPERVWQELARGLMEKTPARMFDVLRACGALARLFPAFDGLDASARTRTALALGRAAAGDAGRAVRFAVLLHAVGADEGAGVTVIAELCARFAVPRDERDLALLVRRDASALAQSFDPALNGRPASAATLVDVLERGDAFRRRARYDDVVAAVACLLDGAERRAAFARDAGVAIDAAANVDAATIARATAAGDDIRVRIHAARVAALDALWQNP